VAGVLRREKFSSTRAFSFEDLESKVRAVLERARAQARQTIAQAEQQGRQSGARLEIEARQRGFQEGHQEGLEQARTEAAQTALQEAQQELAQLCRALTEGLSAFEEGKRRLLATAECGLIDLALAAARRVCKHDVGKSSATVRANVQALLEMVKHEHDLEVHLNPAECDALRAALPELIASTGRLAHVEIVADPIVERGGCLLHTSSGTIDASVELQLERVAKALVQQPSNES
jgi:flagellar assembly protein FliH